MRNTRKTKQRLLAFFCASLVLLFPACTDSFTPEYVPPEEPPQEEPWQVSEKSLVSILEESHYTPGEFVDALGAPTFREMIQAIAPEALPWADALIKAKVLLHLPGLDYQFAKECGTGSTTKRCWEIQSYVFSYRSQTVDGRDVVLSGRVTFPNNLVEDIPHQVKSLSLHTHQAFFDPAWTPSGNLMFMPLKALWDSAVIEPDLQKWGITYGIEADGCGSSVHMARQLADCAVAAMEVMQRQGVTLAPDGYTTNWGSSQGAATTLAFARWYETEAPRWFKDALRMKSSFAAEGPVGARPYFEYTFKHPEQIPLAVALLVGYFKAFSQVQLGGYLPGDFVPSWFNDAQFEWGGRKVSLLDAFTYYFPEIYGIYLEDMTSFDKVFAPDMLTAGGKVDVESPKMRAWLSCLQKYDSFDDWHPVLPVFLANSLEDDMIPFELASSLYRTISNLGKNDNAHLLVVPSIGNVPTGGMDPHFVIAFFIQVEMACAKDPEDMQLIYRTVE